MTKLSNNVKEMKWTNAVSLPFWSMPLFLSKNLDPNKDPKLFYEVRCFVLCHVQQATRDLRLIINKSRFLGYKNKTDMMNLLENVWPSVKLLNDCRVRPTAILHEWCVWRYRNCASVIDRNTVWRRCRLLSFLTRFVFSLY